MTLLHKGIMLIIPFFLSALVLCGTAQEAKTQESTQMLSPLGTDESWFQMYNTPEREFYVSPNGTGDGSFDTPMNLTTAINNSQPGDLYWLSEGIYSGFFVFQNDATKDSPIVYRAYPGQHVQVIGALKVEGAWTWIWGLDISDPDQTVDTAGVEVLSAGVHIVNNYIHHHLGNNGLAMWNTGPGQITYGNVIQYNGYDTDNHPHNIYSQNDFYQYGYKYYVNNIVVDSACGNCFNFHGYTEGGFITGFVLQDNIFANGRVLIGGYNVPAEHEHVLNNYFFNANMQFGYRRPTQTEFTGNKLYDSALLTEWFWGAGEVRYIQTAPNVYTYNTILAPSDKHVTFGTSAYTVNGRENGGPGIQPDDIWNNNVYSVPFNADFNAGGVTTTATNLSEWQQLTADAGNAFDTYSIEVPLPTVPEVILLPNAYDPTYTHGAIYNWGNTATVSVDLSSIIAPGTSYIIYDARDMYGTPLASGIYNDSLNIAMDGIEYMVMVITTP